MVGTLTLTDNREPWQSLTILTLPLHKVRTWRIYVAFVWALKNENAKSTLRDITRYLNLI